VNISDTKLSFQKDPDRKTRQTNNECLPRSERLCGKRAFSPAFKARKRLKLPYMAIVYAPSSIASTRMGISIGKAYGNAVERNRAKRLIREFFRRNKNIFPAGLDMVFIPYKGFLRVDIKAFEEKFENLFNETNNHD
jgi:ribonuclease P protein component